MARVVTLARKVVSDLEPDEVPSALVTVAAQTGPRLVPPLQRRLIEEIESNEWLRDQVSERFEGELDTDDPLEKAASLFLRRPEGWENRLEELVRISEEAEQSDRLETMARRIEALETELDTWRNRAKRNRRTADEAAAQAARRVAAARAEARAFADSGRLEELERDNRLLRRELEKVSLEQEGLRQRLAETRADLRRERRTERPVDPKPAPSAWASLGPLEAARLLDDVVEAFSPASAFEETVVVPAEAPLELPLGMAPDDRSAIEWLLTLDRDFVLLVDGYNVGYHLDQVRFNSPDIRRRLENDMARLKGLARGRPRVTLVYDSDQPGGTTCDSGTSGIEIRFTSAGHTADDELLALAAELGQDAVVVSSDRMVREGAQASGSLGLWSEALARWILNT